MHASGHELAPILVTAPYDHGFGATESASQGVVGEALMGNRALQRPADLLESIPGLVVTQHSGEGKANQYFLRGMNLDHGTDFATTLNGVPINLPTHGHGHGYTDLNLLIPELVSQIAYRKGPYYASEGDFSSAGSAHITYRAQLERPIADVTVGQRGYLRSLVGESRTVSDGLTLLTAVERLNNNGPWTSPEGLRKTNAQLLLSEGSPREGWRTSLSAYAAHWRATDQVPQRLLDAGIYQGQPFGRFDAIDPTDGAQTSRTSWSGTWHQASAYHMTQLNWYVIQYDLSLFSNFTYSLRRPSDQQAQTDHRRVWGGQVDRTWFTEGIGGRLSRHTMGVQVRQDRIRVGLYDSGGGQIETVVRDDAVVQSQLGFYAENESEWSSWARTVLGIRSDQLAVQVHSQAQPQNSGVAGAAKVSPKLAVILGPWAKSELFFNVGKGFHSNDARGMVAQVDPRTAQPIRSVPGLVNSRGQEIGLKSQWSPSFQSEWVWWQLDFDSELVYVGDAGNTQAGRPSHRKGLEWRSHWTPHGHGVLDAGLAWTRPRYADADTTSAYIPNAVQKVANLTLTQPIQGPWSVVWGMRYVGPAALTEDNAIRSSSSVTTHLRIRRVVSRDLALALDIHNVSNRKNNDISYDYTSRVAGEPPGGVQDIHLHPAEPRSIRLTAQMRF